MKHAFLGAVLAALALLCALSPADARRAHRVGAHQVTPVPGAMIDDRYPHLRLPEAYGAARAWKRSSATTKSGNRFSEGLAAAISAPHRFIAGRLICAVNVGAALAERGIAGTGSALAKSYLSWGHPSGPVPGAVAVFNRGNPHGPSGHVAIVAAVAGGTVMLWNPTRHGWRLTPMHRQAIAYRMPA